MNQTPDIITIGGTRIVSVRAVAHEMGLTGPEAELLIGELSLLPRMIGGRKYVLLYELERSLVEWMGGQPDDTQKAGSYYAAMLETSLRARLRRLAGRAPRNGRRRTSRRTRAPERQPSG